MNRTIFVIPQDLTWRQSSTAVAHAINLLNNEAGIVFRSNNLTGVFVQFRALGSYDVIALAGTNLRGADTIRIRAANAEANITTTPDFDQVVTLASGSIKDAGALYYYQFASAVSYDFIRIDFLSTNAAGFVEASRLIVGKAISADGIDTGLEITYDNALKSYLTPYRTLPTWKMAVSGLTEDQYWNVWDQVLTDLGEYKSFLLIPDTSNPHLQRQQRFCRFVSSSKAIAATSDYYTVEMVLGTIL